MKDFKEFLKEDFNSPTAKQFEIDTSSLGRKTGQKPIVFYEHINEPNFQLVRYVKSFRGQSTAELMKTEQPNFRFCAFFKPTSVDIFGWDAMYEHATMVKLIEQDKTNRFPKARYLKAYNESQMYDSRDTIGSFWCFPFGLFDGVIFTNLSPSSLGVMKQQKSLSTLLGLDHSEWNRLYTRQEI